MTDENTRAFCMLVIRMAPAEVTRFTDWMAEELRKSKALEAKAGE